MGVEAEGGEWWVGERRLRDQPESSESTSWRGGIGSAWSCETRAVDHRWLTIQKSQLDRFIPHTSILRFELQHELDVLHRSLSYRPQSTN